MSEGFLLAATLAGDRHAALGRTKLAGLASVAFEAWMQTNVGTSDAERRARIASISRHVAAPMTTAEHRLTVRALALLAPLAERAVGKHWLRQAPAPRAGYQAEPGLRRVLRTIAERGAWDG